MNRNSKSFTLIEMIVVMAIILMLALLLYPVTIKVIKKGEQIQCASNLTQLSYALTMYLQDNGMYPPSARYAALEDTGSIARCLMGYLENQREMFICPSTESPFKLNGMSYVYNEGIEKNAENDWLLVCARLPENPNPHLGDMANILWVDGHVKAEIVEVPDE